MGNIKHDQAKFFWVSLGLGLATIINFAYMFIRPHASWETFNAGFLFSFPSTIAFFATGRYSLLLFQYQKRGQSTDGQGPTGH